MTIELNSELFLTMKRYPMITERIIVLKWPRAGLLKQFKSGSSEMNRMKAFERIYGDRDALSLSNVAENNLSMHEIIHKNKVSTTSVNN